MKAPRRTETSGKTFLWVEMKGERTESKGKIAAKELLLVRGLFEGEAGPKRLESSGRKLLWAVERDQAEP